MPRTPTKSARTTKPAKSSAPKAPRATRAARPKKKASLSAELPADLLAGLTAALDKKAIDLVALDLRRASAFTDFFVICTGATARQVQAIADGIQDALRKRGSRPALVEGERKADWILVDYFDVIFHIFTPATREFYALERLWGDAEKMDLSTIVPEA